MVDLSLLDARIVAELVRLGGQFRGGRWQILCPLHAERTPSFLYLPGVGYKCHGCGASGIMKDAARVLGLTPGSETMTDADRARYEADRIAVMAMRAEEERLAGLALADYWHHSNAAAELTRHEGTLARLASEGIDRLAVEHFGLGWQPFGGIPALTIPWTVAGEVRAVQYRLLSDDPPGGRYRWHKGGKPTIFNADAVKAPTDDRIIVVEGAKKCMTLWGKGVESTCAIANKGAWRPEWARHFAAFRTVVFALDPDASGEALAAALTVPGARVAYMPAKPDDMLVRSGGDVELLMAYIDSARRVD